MDDVGWDPSALVPYFDVTNTTVAIAALTVELLPADPQRIGFMVGINAGSSITISTRGGLNPSTGFFVGQTPLKILFREFGPLVCLQWFVRSVAGASTYELAVTRYLPRRGR